MNADTASLLRIVQQVAVLVQGNWVVRSDVLYPKDTSSNISGVPAELMCRGRDYIVSLKEILILCNCLCMVRCGSQAWYWWAFSGSLTHVFVGPVFAFSLTGQPKNYLDSCGHVVVISLRISESVLCARFTAVWLNLETIHFRVLMLDGNVMKIPATVTVSFGKGWSSPTC